MKLDKNVILCLALVAAAVLFWWSCMKPKQSRESFGTTGSMQNLGSISYDLIEQDAPSLDAPLGAPHFADLINSGDLAEQVEATDEDRPIERLARLQDSYIPKIASRALPFSQAAAKPLTHSFSTTAPRVNLKGKLYEMNLATAVRGSVAINYDPNVAIVAKSQYGPSDSYNPGFMTSSYDSMYRKLTGNHKNMPLYTAGAGSAAGIGGSGVEVIMDI